MTSVAYAVKSIVFTRYVTPYLDSSPDARGVGRLKVDCSRIFGPLVGQ